LILRSSTVHAVLLISASLSGVACASVLGFEDVTEGPIGPSGATGGSATAGSAGAAGGSAGVSTGGGAAGSGAGGAPSTGGAGGGTSGAAGAAGAVGGASGAGGGSTSGSSGASGSTGGAAGASGGGTPGGAAGTSGGSGQAGVSGASGQAGAAGACGDTSTDAKNCGRCGHDCGKGACTGGVCEAFVVMPALNGPTGLAVNGEHVFVADNANFEILRASKVDGSGLKKIASSQPNVYFPQGVAIDPEYVYWANSASPGGSIKRCPLDGCGAMAALELAYPLDEPTNLVLDGPTLYWAEHTGGVVRKADKLDGANQVTLVPLSSGESPRRIALDATHVFYTDDSTNSAGLHRIAKAGGDPAYLSNDRSTSVAVAGEDVFFSGGELGAGILYRLKKADLGQPGAAPTPFVTSLITAPIDAVADDRFIYLALMGYPDEKNGAILACPLNGDTPIALATGLISPDSIALDESFVYWSNYGLSDSAVSGSVMKVAKPLSERGEQAPAFSRRKSPFPAAPARSFRASARPYGTSSA
jgi:hypothetical protein